MGWLPTFLVVTLGFLLAASEWVEIPQFSDQRKIYRTPTLHGLVLRQKATSLRNISELSENPGVTLFNNQSRFLEHSRAYTTQRVISSIIGETDEHTEMDSDEDIAAVSSEEESMTQFDQSSVMDDSNEDIITTIDPMETTTIPLSGDSLNTSQYFNQRDNKNEFLDYLPINLLKRVHKTLKSQPPTLKGKIRFLKVFERTLLSEIESRLSAALAPSRMPREARNNYDVDYHEDKIGFPSLEGTLLAISFLTFAVYLVKLVMMLFRNPGTIGTAPIVIGRRKRSIDDYNEETARILNYLDTSLPFHY